MKTMMKVWAVAALGMLLGGCVRENIDSDGREIIFGARTEMSQITRTTYSGVINTLNNIERINWDNGDKIRIYSNEASDPSTHYADYSLTRTTKSGIYDYASAEPSGSAHGLIWGTGTHSFFSVYPAPTTSSVASGDPNLSYSNGSGVVEAILEADQSISTTKRTEGTLWVPAEDYYGNMNLAYMTAATTGTEGTDITLSFTPIVTTFYVTVTNTTGAAMTLRKVALSSAVNALTGIYQTTFNTANARSYLFYEDNRWVSTLLRTDSNSSIYMEFSGGLSLDDGDCVTVALFAIPKDITELTLTVTSDEQGRVSLPLKYQGNWITFTGGNKHNISNLNVPAVSYLLTVDKSTLTYDYTGVSSTDQQFTVTHTKTIGSIVNPGSWKTQIKNASNQWVDLEGNCPTWLQDFPLNSTGKTTANANINDTPATSHTYQKDVSAQPVTPHIQRLKDGQVYTSSGSVYDNSTESAALDLSKYDFVYRRQDPNRTTANTYIVSAPGWYKIPMLYGNIIENNSIVANSCKGAAWALGHLDYFKKATDANIWLGVGYPWLQDSFLQHARIHWEKYTDWVSNAPSTSGRQWSSGSDIGVIDEVKLQQLSTDTDGMYMYFHVDEDDILPGNALLAVYDDDWTCCWSWQIWITDQRMNLITVGSNNVLPVNLGWTDETEGQYYEERSCVLKFVSTEIANLETQEMTVIQPELERVSTSGWQTYYQWGRKDPMSTGVTNPYQDDGTINESIKHPSNIMHDESNHGKDGEYYDWTSANYNNLWDSQNNSYSGSTSLPNHKTVYDPSPRGFSVPPDNAWDSFSSDYEEVVDNSVTPSVFRGINFNLSSSPIFFPASGYVEFNYASLADANAAGYYWTSHPGTDQNVQKRASFCLRFTANSIVPKDYAATSPFTNPAFRANAYSVRPVQYSVSYADSPSISGTTTTDIVFEDYESTWGWNTQNAGTALGGYYHQFDNTQNNPETRTVGGVTISVRNTTNLTTYSPAYYYNDDEKYLLLENNDELKISVPNHEIVFITLFLSSVDGTPGNYATITASPVNPGIFTDGRGRKGESANWQVTSYTTSTLNPSTNTVTFTTAGTGGNRKITGISVTYK